MANSCSNSTGHILDKATELCIYCGAGNLTGFPYKDEVDVQELDRLRIEEAQKTPQVEFTNDDITKTMNEIFDMQERSLVNFILLGDLAKACRENKPYPIVEQIELTIPKSILTYEVRSLFKTWGFTETSSGYEFEYSIPLRWHVKVPVKIYVYYEKFKLFDVPDRVWAGVDGIMIPNPFDSYWKIRHLVKKKLEKGLKLSSEEL